MNTPNKLTLFRIILIPVFMLLIIFRWPAGSVAFGGTTIPWFQIWAVIVFAGASVTDWFDGHLARAHHQVTTFGKFADPLADKMLVMTAMIFLVGLKMAPAWVVAIIVCRELAVTGLRLMLVENSGQVLAAKMPGKIKTTTQMLAIIFLLLNDVFFAAVHIPIGEILLYVCLFFTLYSGWDYFHQSKDAFKGGFK